MKIVFALFLMLNFEKSHAQELFVYTEPASNMATKSIGLRLNNYFMNERFSSKYNYHFVPEIMWGVSKRLMIHAEGFFSNRTNSLKAEGGGLYIKYRFYSQDEVHSHSRMAAYLRGAVNNSDIHQPAIDLNGQNSGYEAGLVATKLMNKLALSVNGSFVHAADNSSGNKFPYADKKREAVAYAFSAGQLILPKEYKNYEQTNLNAMIEVLGQTNLNSGRSYIDLAPSVQFIFLSKMRLDIGYRFPVLNDLERTAPEGFLLRFEYNFFNAYK